jgi:hypothetical protein
MFTDGDGIVAFACNGEEGPQGIQGVQGIQGLQGEQGPSGVPDNVVTVGPGAGAMFASLQDAMATLSGLDASSRTQVLVAPGSYGGGTLTIPPFVDVIGSSSSSTIIAASVVVSASDVVLRHIALSSSGQGAALLIQGSSGSTVLDDVDITRTGTGSDDHQGINALGVASLRLHNVRITATGGRTAHAMFVHPGPTALDLDDCTLTASGAFSTYGIQLGFVSTTSGSTLRIKDSNISASGGAGDVAALWVDGSHSVNISRSILQSPAQYLHLQGGAPTVTARFSELRGSRSVATGSATCIAAIDKSDAFLATGCPP